jgi:hypothetical protein
VSLPLFLSHYGQVDLFVQSRSSCICLARRWLWAQVSRSCSVVSVRCICLCVHEIPNNLDDRASLRRSHLFCHLPINPRPRTPPPYPGSRRRRGHSHLPAPLASLPLLTLSAVDDRQNPALCHPRRKASPRPPACGKRLVRCGPPRGVHVRELLHVSIVSCSVAGIPFSLVRGESDLLTCPPAVGRYLIKSWSIRHPRRCQRQRQAMPILRRVLRRGRFLSLRLRSENERRGDLDSHTKRILTIHARH